MNRVIADSGASQTLGGALPVCPHCSTRTRADILTGLADRALFRDELASHLERMGEQGGPAVLLIDLDRFKAVNDSLGHSAGDALLRSVANRLRRTLRPGDLAARLGGDEFAVLLVPQAGTNAATAIASRLVDVLSRPYLLDGRVAIVGASIGVAFAPADGADADTLIRRADLALYQSKGQGRGRYSLYVPELQARAEARRELEQRLRAALPLGQLELHYQPQVEVGSGRLSGFEALLRWHRPGIGLVSPDQFIPLAEELGLISAMGAWVIRTATAEAAGWTGPARVAVNVAAQQFENEKLVGIVSGALAASGLPGNRLELEITESALLKDSAGSTLSQLKELKSLGVHISLDDFGTGYASLSQLRSFPFDKVKIDRSFANDLPVVRAVAALAAGLKMRSTAEGIETPAQLEQLRTEGCSEAQGYLISKPVPASEIPELFARLGVADAAHFNKDAP